jgi:hypothetical protein
MSPLTGLGRFGLGVSTNMPFLRNWPASPGVLLQRGKAATKPERRHDVGFALSLTFATGPSF